MNISIELLGHLDGVFDNLNDGLNIVDTNGNLIYCNKVSADYVDSKKEAMIGQNITLFYPKAMLLNVLSTKEPILDKKIHSSGNKRYVVSSYPIFEKGQFVGAYSIFKNIEEIDALNTKIKLLELQLRLSSVEEDPMSIIGTDDSLKNTISRAKRTVGSLGGPRHSIIIGESGTGKTMLANIIYTYAKKIGVIEPDAPFVEINCAQYTNSDIAAVEIFGSEEGAYTGSKKKKGLFEQANGGILFLDEAHALEHYQSILLKAIESGKIRRIGGSKETQVNVIIIAASTRNLKDELLPELYQRLAQYELTLPSLSERNNTEKNLLIDHFIKKYKDAVRKFHDIEYNVTFSPEARNALATATYPRNIRQLRDVINMSIDSASPLISDIKDLDNINTTVELKDLPFEISLDSVENKGDKIDSYAENYIYQLSQKGLGPRKISNKLKEAGYDIEYYKIAYFLKTK